MGGIFCYLCRWMLNLVLQAAVVESCGFCLNGGEFLGLLKRIFLTIFFFWTF